MIVHGTRRVPWTIRDDVTIDEIRHVRVGDTVVMRKPHPCGNAEWTVTRIGADIGLKCAGCGRRVMLPRETFERDVRRHTRHEETADNVDNEP